MATQSPKLVAKIGRPSSFTEEVAGSICMEIMAGKSLRTICAMKGMPSTSTVYAWLGQYPEFSDMYARAREIQADVLADEILEIADSEIDTNRARVMIDSRKWLAGKLRPKKYGDRVEVEHSGGNPGMVVTVNVLPAPVTPPVLDAEVVKPALPTVPARFPVTSVSDAVE